MMSRSNSHSSTEELAPGMLLSAYASGFFPMADSRVGEIHWYSPDPRAIIPLDTFKVSRSLRQAVKKDMFSIRVDTAFEEVMRACGERKETWISEEIVQAYVRLFDHGYAHSVESWSGERLVGGLYGVALGGAFFGESMFSRAREASKVALVHLVDRLRAKGFTLLDTQFTTPHLFQFGTMEISRDDYLSLLSHAIQLKRSFV